MIKTIIILTFGFVQNLLAANLPDFTGTYRFDTDKLSVTSAQRIITIAVRNQEAKKYVLELSQSGYQCALKPNSIYQCKKFDRTIAEDQGIRSDLIVNLSSSVLHFELTNNDYEQVNDADSLKEYQRRQNSSFASSKFSKLHIYILAGGLLKFKLYNDDDVEQAHFYLNSEKDISQQITANKSQVKNAPYVIDDHVNYLYEAVWNSARR